MRNSSSAIIDSKTKLFYQLAVYFDVVLVRVLLQTLIRLRIMNIYSGILSDIYIHYITTPLLKFISRERGCYYAFIGPDEDHFLAGEGPTQPSEPQF